MSEDDDALVERALEIVLARPDGWRSLVRRLAEENPEATIAELAAAIARTARAIEQAFVDGDADGLPPRLYRLAALSWLDARTMERSGWSDATASDLAFYRQLHDEPVLSAAFAGDVSPEDGFFDDGSPIP